MGIRTRAAVGAIALLLAGNHAAAQDPPTTLDDQIKQEQLRALQLANDKAAGEQAVAPLAQLPAGDGASGISEGGGALEAALLAAQAARTVAAGIESSPGVKGVKQIILVGGDEPVSVDTLVTFRARAQSLRRVVAQSPDCPGLGGSTALSIQPSPGTRPRDTTISTQALAPAAAASLALGLATRLFQNSTQVSGIQVARDDHLLLAEMAKALNTKDRTVILPSVRLAVPLDLSGNATSWAIRDLLAVDALTSGIRACLAGLTKNAKESASAIARVTLLDTAVTGFVTGATTPSQSGRVELVEAVRQEWLLDAIETGAPVLRVRSSFAGGSALAIRNIGTAFGAPGLKVSGGLIASWTLTNPNHGTLLASGSALAGCGLHRVRAIQDQKSITCHSVPRSESKE
jgi:hypothetical protein